MAIAMKIIFGYIVQPQFQSLETFSQKLQDGCKNESITPASACPVPPSQLIPSRLFRLLVHTDFQFIFYDLPILIAVLVIEHILDDVCCIDPWPQATFALFNLTQDEG